MHLKLNTAVSTAVIPIGVSFKTLQGPESGSKTLESASEGGKPSKGERGVWLEHGKWAASAGFDPQTKERITKAGFVSKTEAIEWRAKQLAKKTTDQASRRQIVRELSEGECIDAAKALDQLVEAGFTNLTLQTAAEYYLKRHPQSNPTTVRWFYEEWIQSKVTSDCRPHTIRSAKNTIKEFVQTYGDKNLTDIEFEHIKAYVFDPRLPNHTTRRGRGVVLTNFFNVAQLLRKIGSEATDHPCYGLMLPPPPEGEPDPWTVDEFKTLLAFAWATEDEFHATAYIAIGALAGVRTEELVRLRFGPRGINIDAGKIHIRGGNAKKRRSRTFMMLPELKRILVALRERPQIRLKYVRPLPRPTDLGSKIFSRKLLVDFKQALVAPIAGGGAGMPIVDVGGKTHRSKNGKITITGPSAWKANGLRASFATYHYALHDDARSTAGIMGHTGSLDVFFEYYRALAEKEDGEAFFAAADAILRKNVSEPLRVDASVSSEGNP